MRFKGGDNFVFGRGYEEVIACREAGVPVTVIPGLSSPIAVPAIAGHPRDPPRRRPRVHRRLGPPAAGSPEVADRLGRRSRGCSGTLCLMMAVEHAPQIAAALLAGGQPSTTPVAVVCDGTMPAERTVLTTLGELVADIAAQAVTPPAIIVVGDVVAVAHPERYADADG